ncbi:MAG: hypothetical protein KDJ29_03605 [Hyphomicrobiales bacterium]|nr:hypothetical protein [Hyphomicrobiales bacterium]
MQSGQEPLKLPEMDRSFVDRDKRAENHQRTVHFESNRIVIMRRIHGVSMRVTMPVQRYAGVGVLLPNLAENRRAFSIMLVHEDPDLSVCLFEGSDPLLVDAALAEWAQFFELPVLGGDMPAGAGTVFHADADVECGQVNAEPVAIGKIMLGDVPPMRRRGGTLAKRRPRFFARRRVGLLERMDEVHEGEREIIARN